MKFTYEEVDRKSVDFGLIAGNNMVSGEGTLGVGPDGTVLVALIVFKEGERFIARYEFPAENWELLKRNPAGSKCDFTFKIIQK